MKGDLPILIVESHAKEKNLLKRAIRHNAITNPVFFAGNKAEAFDYLGSIFYHPLLHQNRLPGVIILNHTLSSPAALSFLAALKQDDIFQQIPVIVFSSSTNAEDMDACYAEGCNGYFTKPYNIEEYTKVVKVIYDFWLHAAALPYYIEKIES